MNSFRTILRKADFLFVVGRMSSLFIVLTIFTMACSGRKEVTPKKTTATVDVMIAEKTRFESSIEVNGEALSEEMIELHPEISGRLIYLNIPDGSRVTKGTVLARINDADLQAQLKQQNVLLDLAKKQEQRLGELLKVNGVNQADYDAALSQVHSLEANIEVLEAQIDKSVIRAAFNGKLGLRMVSNGAYVTPQTVIGTLQDPDHVKIDFTVPELYSPLVSIGSDVSVATNESDDKHIARITAIEPQINVATRNILVRARLEEGNVNPGAFVKVYLKKKQEGFMVPANALIPEASSNQVIVLKKGKAVFTKVETGDRQEDMVQLASGVSTGDTIVVSGVLFVRPGINPVVRSVKPNSFAALTVNNTPGQ